MPHLRNYYNLPGSVPGVDVDVDEEPSAVSHSQRGLHEVKVTNRRPNQLDNVVVTSRAARGFFLFVDSGIKSWSKEIGDIPEKSRPWQWKSRSDHIAKRESQLEPVGAHGNRDTITTIVTFSYSTAGAPEEIKDIKYNISIG
jgi:hypothetical protein